MKTNLKFGFITMFAISLLIIAIGTGNIHFTGKSDYVPGLFSAGEKVAENTTDNSGTSGTYVHPGIGFEDEKESNEYFITAYGIRPPPEMRTDEWSDKLEEVHHDLAREFIETGIATISKNLSTMNGSRKLTIDELRKACIENQIDISSGLIKYHLGGKNSTLIYSVGVGDGFIAVHLNMDEDVNESLKAEIYGLYYQRGKELGINDVPVVFEAGGPLILD